MDFPLTGLMDEGACYERLAEALHADGLACPRRGGDHFGAHRRHRDPVVDYRCGRCRRVFDIFTGTALQGTGRRPSELIQILRGIAQGTPTAQLARELECDRMKLPDLRHKLRANATAGLDPATLPDAIVEADECYVNAGGKRPAAHHPGAPPAAAGQQAARARDVR